MEAGFGEHLLFLAAGCPPSVLSHDELSSTDAPAGSPESLGASYGGGGWAAQASNVHQRGCGRLRGGWPTSPPHHCTAQPQKKPRHRRAGLSRCPEGLPMTIARTRRWQHGARITGGNATAQATGNGPRQVALKNFLPSIVRNAKLFADDNVSTNASRPSRYSRGGHKRRSNRIDPLLRADRRPPCRSSERIAAILSRNEEGP